MKDILKVILLSLFFSSTLLSQGFKVKASGEQTFSFDDKVNRNQASFFSTTPLEDITGLTNDISGSVTFDVEDVATLKGKISITTASLKTGIELRDTHLKSPDWLDAESYPEITFKIKSISDINKTADSKIDAKVTGDFTAHGVTKEVVADVSMTYLDESEKTKARASGDLFGVEAKFNINLSDFEVEHMVLGQKVAENIEVTATLVGSNAQ
jgi:polyisoprenoid-binding protein YceI